MALEINIVDPGSGITLETGGAITLEVGVISGPPGADGSSGTPTPVLTTTGSASAFVITGTGFASLTTPKLCLVSFHTPPAAGATLDPDSLGPLPLQLPTGSPVAGGEVLSGLPLWVILASTYAKLQSIS